MGVLHTNSLLCTVLLTIVFSPCEAIKCYDCNSANNSACLDMYLHRMHAVVPIVDCGKTLPNIRTKYFFCRKITQTILHTDKTPEVRITRSCGWVKHKRQCYTADNKDHLETVCQCFGDMCNAATTLNTIRTIAIGVLASFLQSLRTWSGKVY